MYSARSLAQLGFTNVFDIGGAGSHALNGSVYPDGTAQTLRAFWEAAATNLATVTNVEITSNLLLTWNTVPNATSYTVFIFDEGDAAAASLLTTNTAAAQALAVEYVTVTEASLNVAGLNLASGRYIARIQANGDATVAASLLSAPVDFFVWPFAIGGTGGARPSGAANVQILLEAILDYGLTPVFLDLRRPDEMFNPGAIGNAFFFPANAATPEDSEFLMEHFIENFDFPAPPADDYAILLF